VCDARWRSQRETECIIVFSRVDKPLRFWVAIVVDRKRRPVGSVKGARKFEEHAWRYGARHVVH
jgi:hypothetical protein